MSEQSKPSTQPRPKYVIYAPSYDEDNGGAIFLHLLAETLIDLGEDAVLYQMEPIYELGRLLKLWNAVIPPRFDRLPGARAKVVTRKELTPDSIVVYPEIVPGNPLGLRNIARWLMYKPGVLHAYLPTENELTFSVGPFSDEPARKGELPRLFLWRVNPAYVNRGREDRSGSCYLMRKGEARQALHDLSDSVQIDGMSHSEIAEVFNAKEFFYSYDEATMYSQFAALCGCTSIVVPDLFESEKDYFTSRPIAQYGIAFGETGIPHARATMHLVRDQLRKMEEEGRETVVNFVRLTKESFGF
ncbi:MAG: hypothetical protein AAGC81_07940 [Pseudomonadota bacterium]